MRFRPCIDIHNGEVKQIVGGSLKDSGNQAENNFISNYDAAFYANLYQKDGLRGGHIILLNPVDSEFYERDLEQAKKALQQFPGGLQIGGGVTTKNAKLLLDLGASHVIVTSYVFRDGKIDYERLEKLSELVGKEHLVLDLSCRFVNDDYYIVTDRWQKVTTEKFNPSLLEKLSAYCDEYLVHAVDVEGKKSGIEKEVIRRMAQYQGLPITYAGGIHTLDDIYWIKDNGENRVDYTIGSALDLFGGKIPYQKIITL